MTDTGIELFTEFAWAVPKAFSVPLRDCRFEQGDRLYSTPLAYDQTWNDALPHLEWSIEVLSPPRGQGVQKNGKDSASTFAANWLAQVELVLTNHKHNQSEIIKTTQGRLYTTLWRGEASILSESTPQPEMPLKTIQFNEVAELERLHFLPSSARRCSIFLTPFDETNDIFSSKTESIEDALKATCSFEFRKERPHVVYRKSSDQFAPTLYVGCYVINSTDRQKLDAAFKKALYVPVKDKITDRENWKLEKHGRLVEVGI